MLSLKAVLETIVTPFQLIARFSWALYFSSISVSIAMPQTEQDAFWKTQYSGLDGIVFVCSTNAKEKWKGEFCRSLKVEMDLILIQSKIRYHSAIIYGAQVREGWMSITINRIRKKITKPLEIECKIMTTDGSINIGGTILCAAHVDAKSEYNNATGSLVISSIGPSFNGYSANTIVAAVLPVVVRKLKIQITRFLRFNRQHHRR